MIFKAIRAAAQHAFTLGVGIVLVSVFPSSTPALAEAMDSTGPSLAGPWTMKIMGHTWNVVLSKSDDKEGDATKYCGTGNREEPDKDGKPVTERICAWLSTSDAKFHVALGALTTCESSSGKEPTITGKCSFGGMFEGRLEATRQNE